MSEEPSAAIQLGTPRLWPAFPLPSLLPLARQENRVASRAMEDDTGSNI